MVDIKLEIEKLLNYGMKYNLIDSLDKIFVRNQLLELFELKEPYDKEIIDDEDYDMHEILDKMILFAKENNIIESAKVYENLLDTKIMGLLTPRQSEITKNFYSIANDNGIKYATEYLYELSQSVNYIRTKEIKKNIKWNVETEYGSMNITINLSKPEKDPKTIELEKKQPVNNYPKCLLCLETMGFSGNITFPARQNLRVIPLKFENDKWYMWYSPYSYYNEHCIVLNKKHIPMSITAKTARNLLNFVKFAPHYFCGSNADLPIVGGSMLSHDHYQGGNYDFPMNKAKTSNVFVHSDYSGINIEILYWPLSVIRISGQSINMLVRFFEHVLNGWLSYENSDINILSYTGTNNKIRHNTVTVIAKYKEETEKYQLDIVLRNNRRTEEHPLGIFHPHEDIHHIKKENIGLIEVMGLAILPGRLKKELDSIRNILKGKPYKSDNELIKHEKWIEYLKEKYTGNNLIDLDKLIKKEVGEKFKRCLENSGVFKQNKEGQKAFIEFLILLGCKLK